MADINQIITLGIGTPSDIPHFILFGLSMRLLGTLPVELFERPIETVDLDKRYFDDATLYERA